MRDGSDPDGRGSGGIGSGGGMEGCYVPNNPAHYGLDGGWSIGVTDELSLPTLDLDPLPSLFPFSPCSGTTAPTASFKSEFSTLIGKNGDEVGVREPHDMADVLLSLKHAIVHPGHTCSSSPFTHSYSSSPYSLHPQQMMPVSPGAGSYSDGGGCNNGVPGFNLDPADLCMTSNAGGNWSANTNTNQSPIFPSMSVNVSMNMTMHGYPSVMSEHQITYPQMQWISVPSTSESNSPNYQSQGLLNPHSGNHGGSASYSFTTDFRQSNQNTVEQGFSIYTNPLGSGCGSNRAGSCADGAEGGSGHREEKGATPSYRPVSPISPLSPSNLSSSTPNHLKSVSNYCITISPHNTMSPTLEAPTSPSSKMRKQHGHEQEDELGVKRGQHEHTHMEQGLQLSSIHHDCSNNESGGDRPNLCRICGKTYARPSTLKTHLRTHSGEKPYRCEDCNKSFSQAANLTAHVRTHSGEKPFKCNICDRRFSQSSSVTTHMRTHSGERPYRCRLCRKAFSDSSTLTKHLRIHSGEKPYQCKLCLLRFSQSGNLNRHMRVHGQHYAIPM